MNQLPKCLPYKMEETVKTKKQLQDEITELRRKIKAFENASPNSPEKNQRFGHNEELFQVLVEHASEAILVVENQNIRYANTKSLEITGFSRAGLSSKKFIDLIHPDDRNLISINESDFRPAKGKAKNLTCRLVGRNGQVRWLDAKFMQTRCSNKTVFMCFLTDITERKNNEEALRNSEMKYRQLFEQAPAGIYEIDLTTGKFIRFNDLMCEYMGYTRDEFKDLKLWDLLTEESREQQLARLEKIYNQEPVPEEVEFECIGKNKRKFSFLFFTKIEYKDGRPVRSSSVAHDITERKKLEEEVNKAQKLESLGVLAGGIGHDFNNLLSGIIGNISLAKIEAERGENIMESLDEALRVSAKASALTQQLLVFSKGGAPVKKAASIVEVLRDSAAFTLRGSKVKCEFDIAQDLWPVKVDIGQFSQVIHNLVINALQAMSKGGQIKLQADNITLKKVLDIPLKPGRYVEITVQDDGNGIAPEHLPKIFDPYFSTKSEGSGLGLTMSYTIIKRHDGHIAVESEAGKGTVFRIYLPATEKVPVKTADTELGVIKGEGRILVMDDEEILRKVAERMLHELGYEATCVGDGAEVLETYEKTKTSEKPFDAVIMDLTIPGGMGGKETIKKLLEIDPKAVVVVSSGYSNDPIISSYEKYG
ncbi:MAG: PAS domain S-box protein, partial [Desulfobacterales bacterium]